MEIKTLTIRLGQADQENMESLRKEYMADSIEEAAEVVIQYHLGLLYQGREYRHRLEEVETRYQDLHRRFKKFVQTSKDKDQAEANLLAFQDTRTQD